jgi:t-SNARE syntaxin family protein
VRAAEAEPSRFGLAPAEIKRRARLVQEVGGEVDDMRDELAKQQQQHQQQASTTTTTTSTSRNNKNPDLPDPSSFAIRDGDDSYAEFEQQQQEVMMREQDGQLDDVFRTVGNLRRQADDMGRELEEQREMIVEVDQLADRVGGRLATGMQKLQYIVRRNEDTLSSWCIGLLIFVLIILLVLLLINSLTTLFSPR